MVRHPGICLGVAIITRDGARYHTRIADSRQQFVHDAAADAAFEPIARVGAIERYTDHPLISGDITLTDCNSKIVDTMQLGPGSAWVMTEVIDFDVLSPGPWCADEQQQDRRKYDAE
jgi:hypothetical protein